MAMFKQKQRSRGQETAYDGAVPDEIAPVEEARGSAGALLRKTRESLGWEIRGVSAALRIRVDYLEALERNTVEGLPGPTYATGFLRAYAEYLGLDGHEIVRRFRAEKTGLHNKPELAFPVPLTDRGIPGGGIFLIALLIAALGYGAYYYVTSGVHTTPAAVEPVPARLLPPPPTAPPVTVADAPKPTDTAAPAPGAAPAPATTNTGPANAAPTTTGTPARPNAPAVPGATQTAAAPGAAPAPGAPPPPAVDPDTGKPVKSYGDPAAHRVVVRATSKAWVVIKDGDKPVVNTLFNKGDVYNAPDKPGLTLKTGNAGALEVILDGKALAPLGPTGHVRVVPLDPDKLQGLPPG